MDQREPEFRFEIFAQCPPDKCAEFFHQGLSVRSKPS